MDLSLLPTSRLLARLFCVYAAVAIPMISMLMPPFQAADELAHAERADQVAAGGLIATRFGGDGTSGGIVDPGLAQLAARFDTIRFHPEVKETRAMAGQAAAISRGTRGLSSFPNTAIYPPFLYLPSALGQGIAQVAGLSVLHGMVLSRLLNGAVSVVVAALAIALSGELAPLLFTLFCLPMVLALFASMSQDGPMIAAAALAAVLLTRGGSRRAYAIGCVAVTLAAMARPSYLPLCLLPLLVPGLPLRVRLAGAAGPVAAVLAWTFVADRVTLLRASSVQVARQIHALTLHPGIWTTLIRTTFHIQWSQGCPYCRQFVGVLGWLDTALPDPYYALTALVLLVALVVSRTPMSRSGSQNWVVAAILLAAATGAIFVLEYLSWSPIGGSTIEGVQGRYFLPVVPFLAFILPRGQVRMPPWLLAAFCFYPALSVVVTVRAIVFRYYL